jgi:ubiquinone/menaquinone biosynthesis C-methylase UbiE
LKEWDELSDWYDAKQGETGDLWHRALIDPALLRVIGDSQNKDVLDLGCGNGYLSRRLARNDAKITAVDSSKRMIENAKRHDPGNSLRINYSQFDANHLEFAANSFDLVFANMSLMDIEDADGAISEVGRVLRSGGRFVASISHPCFDNGSNSSWLIEKGVGNTRIYRKITKYRRPFSENIPWKISDDETRFTAGFHRPLSWYARVFKSHGLAITLLEEPEPEKEFLENETDSTGFIEVPLHLIIEAVKL